jgi:hypothetical protein
MEAIEHNNSISQFIANHFRGVYFGGNWTAVDLKSELSDITWKQAITPLKGFNTIAALAYHVHYFIRSVSHVLSGGPLESKDELSFDHPSISGPTDWQETLEHMWREGEQFAQLIEQLTDERLEAAFVDKKYGTYYSNLHGIIEHCHYHLAQIRMLRKLIEQS